MTHSAVFNAIQGVIEKGFAQVAEKMRAQQALRLREVYGPKADVRWGVTGEWQAGYHSRYGFHIKGRHDSDPAAAVALAITEHAKPHGISFPTPQFPNADTCWAQRRGIGVPPMNVTQAPAVTNASNTTTENTETSLTPSDFSDFKSQLQHRPRPTRCAAAPLREPVSSGGLF